MSSAGAPTASDAPTDPALTTTITRRIYFADTDAGGVAHHATYVRWFEQARTEWLHERGQNLALWQSLEMMFVVANLQINYRRSLVLDDLITIATAPVAQHRSGATFVHNIYRDADLVSSGTVRLVCVGITDGRPQPMPEVMRNPTKLSQE